MYRVLYKTYTLQFASCQRGTRQLVEMHSTGTAIGFFSRLQYRVLLEHTHTHTGDPTRRSISQFSSANYLHTLITPEVNWNESEC